MISHHIGNRLKGKTENKVLSKREQRDGVHHAERGWQFGNLWPGLLPGCVPLTATKGGSKRGQQESSLIFTLNDSAGAAGDEGESAGGADAQTVAKRDGSPRSLVPCPEYQQ